MNNKPGHDIVDLYEAINTFKPVDEDIWFVVEARQRAEGFYAEGKRILVSNGLPLKQRGESFSKLGQIVADDRNSILTKSTIWVRQRDGSAIIFVRTWLSLR